jgi:hypothetical protein
LTALMACLQALEKLLFAAKGYTENVLAVCSEQQAGLDPEEHEIVFDEVDAADEHLIIALVGLHPEWEELDDEGLERALDDGFRKHIPLDTPAPRAERDGIVEMLAEACETLFDALGAVEAVNRIDVDDSAADEVDCAIGHLECALLLLDPELFSVPAQIASPDERIRYASRMELLELQLEESRTFARTRLAWMAAGRKWLSFEQNHPEAAHVLLEQIRTTEGEVRAELVDALCQKAGMEEDEAIIFLNQHRP